LIERLKAESNVPVEHVVAQEEVPA